MRIVFTEKNGEEEKGIHLFLYHMWYSME